MPRLLAWIFACALLVGSAGLARAAEGRDFITAMTIDLAVDPARAESAADREIARLSSRGAASADAELAAAYWVKAQASFRLGDAAGARSAMAMAQRRAPTDASGARVRGYASLLEGLLARGDGDFAHALTALRTAQQRFIAANDQRGHALALQSVGVLYNDVGNGEEALRLLTLAENTYSGDDVFLLSLNNNFGVALQTLLRFEESERRLLLARGYARRLGLQGFARPITLNIAANQTFAGKFAEAGLSLDEFEAGSGSVPDTQRREMHRLRAIIAFRQGQRAEALSHIRRALADADPAETDTSYWNAHFAAYEIFKAYGMPDQAFAQLEAVRRIDETNAELVASNRAALLSAQFQFSAQATQIAQLKADNLEREVRFQRTMTITIVIGAVLALGLLASLLLTAIRARNRARADSAELAVVNQRLETALAAKTEFLASTSHELRTPLNGILGMTQILLADSNVAPVHRTQIELLHDAGSTMRALVDDILDVAKIEHGGFTIVPKPTDVGALATRVIRLFAAQAEAARLALELELQEDCLPAMVDPDRLTQILFNLIGNAIKFTPEGMVHVSVSAREGEAPELVVTVRDTGIGIAPEWHDSVFDMFRQVDGARTRNYGGTGLGLAICRQLARAMGGDIALESALGEGASFVVTLPWIRVPAAEMVAASTQRHDAAQHNADSRQDQVVLVGNDPMRLAMLGAIVRRAGYRTSIADTAEKLQQLLTGKRLTLLVDASACGSIAQRLDAGAFIDHRIIIVGDGSGEMPMRHADQAPVVAFSRNAILSALRQPSWSGDGATDVFSALPAVADGGIGQDCQGSEPKRSARMSRK